MDCKIGFLLLLITGLVACASSSGNSQFADTPYIEKIGPGEIKYLNEGASYFRKARREDVYKKISESCNGEFRIVKEGVLTKKGTLQTQERLDDYPSARYVYIKYECVL